MNICDQKYSYSIFSYCKANNNFAFPTSGRDNFPCPVVARFGHGPNVLVNGIKGRVDVPCPSIKS